MMVKNVNKRRPIGYYTDQMKLGQKNEFDSYSMMYSASSNPAKKGDPLYPYIVDKKTGRIITMRFDDVLTNGRGRMVYDMRYLHIDAFTEDQMVIPVYCTTLSKELSKQPASRKIASFLITTNWAKARLRKLGHSISSEKELQKLLDSNQEVRSFLRSQNTIKEFYRTATQEEIDKYKVFYKELAKKDDIGLAVLLDKGLSCIDFDTPMELKEVRLLINKYFKDCDNVIVQMSTKNHHTHFFIPNEYIGVSNFTTKIDGKKQKQHNTGKQKGNVKVGRRVYEYDLRKGDSFYVVVDGNGYGPMMSFQRVAKFNMSDTSMNTFALLSIPSQPVFTDFDLSFYEECKERKSIEKNTHIQRTRLVLSKELIMDNFSWLLAQHKEAYDKLNELINLSYLKSISREGNADVALQTKRIHDYLKQLWEEKIRINNPEKIPSFEDVLIPRVIDVIDGKLSTSFSTVTLPQKAKELWDNFNRIDQKTLKSQGAILDRLYNFEEADGVKVTDIEAYSLPQFDGGESHRYVLQQIPDDMSQAGYATPDGAVQNAKMKYTSLANVEMHSYKRIIRGLFDELYKRISILNNVRDLFENDSKNLRHIIHGLAVIPKQKRFTIEECYELIKPLEDMLVNALLQMYLLKEHEIKWDGSLEEKITIDDIRKVNDLIDLRISKTKKIEDKYKDLFRRTVKPVIIDEINDVYSRTQGHLYETCYDVTGSIRIGSNYNIGVSADDEKRRRIFDPVTQQFSKMDANKCYADTGYFFGQYFLGEATDSAREEYGLNWMPVSLGYNEKGVKAIGLQYYQSAIDRLAEEDPAYEKYRSNINASFENELYKAQRQFDSTCRSIIRNLPIKKLVPLVDKFSDIHRRLWYESRSGNGEVSNSIILGRNQTMEEILIGLAEWAKVRGDMKTTNAQSRYWNAKNKVDKLRKFFENYRNVIRIAINELIDPEFNNMINHLLRFSLTKSSSQLTMTGDNPVINNAYRSVLSQDKKFENKEFTFGDSLANEYSLEQQDVDIANIIFYDFPSIIENMKDINSFIQLTQNKRMERPVALAGFATRIDNNLKRILSHTSRTIYHYELLQSPDYQITEVNHKSPRLIKLLNELTFPISHEIKLYPNQSNNKLDMESRLYLFIKRIDELIMDKYFPNKYYVNNWDLTYHMGSIKKFKEEQKRIIQDNQERLADKVSFMNFQKRLAEAFEAKGETYKYEPDIITKIQTKINWQLSEVPVIQKSDARIKNTNTDVEKEKFLYLVSKLLFPLIRSAKFIDKAFSENPKNAILFDVYELLAELSSELRRLQKETTEIRNFFDAIKYGTFQRDGHLAEYAKYTHVLAEKDSLSTLKISLKKAYVLDNQRRNKDNIKQRLNEVGTELYNAQKEFIETGDDSSVLKIEEEYKQVKKAYLDADKELGRIKNLWPSTEVLNNLAEVMDQFILDKGDVFLNGFILRITDRKAIGKAKMLEHHRRVHNNVLARNYGNDQETQNKVELTNVVSDNKNENLKELAEEINSDELLEIDNSNVVKFLKGLLNDQNGLVLEQLASNVTDPTGHRDIAFLNLAIYLRNHGFDGDSTKEFLEIVNAQLAKPISQTQLDNKVRQAYKVDQVMFDKFIKENHILRANHVEEFKNINMTIPQAFEDNLSKLWDANIYKYKQSKSDADDACETLLGFIPSEVCGFAKSNFAQNAGTDEKFLARMSGDISFRIDEKLLTGNLRTVNTETGEIKEYKPKWKTRKDRTTKQVYQSITGKELLVPYNEFINDTGRNKCQLRGNNGKQSTINRQFKKFTQISEILKDPLTCVYLLQKSLNNTYSGMNGYKTSVLEEIDGQETRFNVSDELKSKIEDTINGLLRIAFVTSDIAKKFKSFETFKEFYQKHVKFFKGNANQSEFNDLLTKVGYRKNVCEKYGKDYINFFEKMDANQIWRCMHNKYFTKKSVGLCKITYNNESDMLAGLFNDTFKKLVIKKNIWHVFKNKQVQREKIVKRKLTDFEIFAILLKLLRDYKNYQPKVTYTMNFNKVTLASKYKHILKAWKDPGGNYGKNKLFNEYQKIKSILKLNSNYQKNKNTRVNLSNNFKFIYFLTSVQLNT